MATTVDREMRLAYEPSPRVGRLRERALSGPPEMREDSWLRLYYTFEGWMLNPGQPLSLRSARALAHVIASMPPRAFPDDLLAGESLIDCAGIVHFSGTKPAGFDQFVREQGLLSDEQKQQLIEWSDPWPFSRGAVSDVLYPEGYAEALQVGLITVWGVDLNHSIRGYEKVLRLGFVGLLAEVEEALADLPLGDPEASSRRANLLGWQAICEAAIGLGARYAENCRALAATSGDADEKRQWEELAEVCARVPAHPARNFREALQALLFAHMITVWEDGVNANSIGRLDQFCWPYLQPDLETGSLTYEQAGELLAALWCKLYQSYDVQQVTLGGQLADGSDATNPLTSLALDVTEGLGFVRCLSVRVHQGTPRPFLRRCVDLLARGGGIPFFFNDETLIPALASKGIPIEAARGYAPIGCIEITIPGQANPHAVSNWINLAKCLELALNDGRCLTTGQQVGPQTGTLADFTSLAEVRAAYTRQLDHAANLAVYGSNAAELAHRTMYRLPYLSLLTDDCVAQGRDIIEGGARYNYHESAAMGLPNVADSLAAIQQAVFTEQTISGSDLLEALRSNFAENEELLQYLRKRMPKYGNDLDLPDGLAAELAQQYCEVLGSHHSPGGMEFFVHLFTFTLMIPFGKTTGATPEGRRAGEPLAYSLSPVQGRDREGFTAMLNSLARIPHHLVAASSSAILEAHPSLLAGEEGLETFTDLLMTAIAQGVGQMQVNVVRAEDLRAAQDDPDRYASLCVRVSGFSQQFVLLDRELQDHIIARTKHEH
jgi:pyruvate formate-lyase/glycerol dehydratase family glycyl radical enzyme